MIQENKSSPKISVLKCNKEFCKNQTTPTNMLSESDYLPPKAPFVYESNFFATSDDGAVVREKTDEKIPKLQNCKPRQILGNVRAEGKLRQNEE